ncbi:hypothetical protein ACP70R_006016 [Stipagrostis hirtigluma subsp. patula]
MLPRRRRRVETVMAHLQLKLSEAEASTVAGQTKPPHPTC